jgi:hypothetical protein
MSPPFDKYSALRIKHVGSSDENSEIGKGADVYDFYVNVDNIYLKTELKSSSQDLGVTEARFVHGLVLLGLALLQQEAQTRELKPDREEKEQANEERSKMDIEDKVEEFTKAVAQVLLPMIDGLGALDLESSASTGAFTGAT